MKVIYSPRYCIDIGLHVFPTEKYRLVHQRLLGSGIVAADDVIDPPPAAWEDLALVHTSEYLEKLRSGTMTLEDVAQLELPWSPEMVDGFRVMVGGTVTASRIACTGERSPASDFRCVAHVGGGLHHAFPNHGEGFCPFNDVAVAIRVMQRDGVERHAIVDLDVHHGNGSSFVFGEDGSVFTLSMHQQHNYPMWKPRSSLDIGLSDGTHDHTYLRELERALPQVLAHRPACIFYLAGADPYEDDQLGGLRLTKGGLRARDRMVIDAARGAGLPLVITLAGGYARRLEDTVAIHCATIEEANNAGTGRAVPPTRPT